MASNLQEKKYLQRCFPLVIPMSSRLGMIEWLDNTRPLKDLIEESYNDVELDVITNQGQHPRKLYQDYVTNTYQKAKPTAKTTSNTQMYSELFLTLTKSQVEEEFNRIQSVIPADLLRRAYYKIANSHEGFYTLRRQFITSYAVLCTSQYILGIGDRHQSKYSQFLFSKFFQTCFISLVFLLIHHPVK